jgi:hypothetical protein
MAKWLDKFLCGLMSHKNRECDTKFKYDKKTQRLTVTETCSRCGRKLRFAFRKEDR